MSVTISDVTQFRLQNSSTAVNTQFLCDPVMFVKESRKLVEEEVSYRSALPPKRIPLLKLELPA